MDKDLNLRESVMKAKEKAIWLSFDMGLKSDCDGLYTWLDSHNAKELGKTSLIYVIREALFSSMVEKRRASSRIENRRTRRKTEDKGAQTDKQYTKAWHFCSPCGC